MGKRLAAVGMSAIIAAGGLGVAAVKPLGVAGAKPASSTAVPVASGPKAERTGPLDRALAKLVADETLTEAQAAKVEEAIKAEAKAGHSQHKGGHDKHRANRADRRAELLAVIAKALGSSPDEVKVGLEDGRSVAAQAEAKGIDRQVVDDAVTKTLTDRIDAAVKDVELPADKAAKVKANLATAVDRILDADGSHVRGRHAKGHGAKGRRGDN